MKKLHLFTLAFLLFSALSAMGQNAIQIPYQGTIADTGGSPYDGIFRFSFDLKTPAGTVVWSSGTRILPVKIGAFSVELGGAGQPALYDTIFKRDSLELEVLFNDGVHGFQTLSPPAKLLPVPYAVRAQFADRLCNDTLSVKILTVDSLHIDSVLKVKIIIVDTLIAKFVYSDTLVALNIFADSILANVICVDSLKAGYAWLDTIKTEEILICDSTTNLFSEVRQNGLFINDSIKKCATLFIKDTMMKAGVFSNIDFSAMPPTEATLRLDGAAEKMMVLAKDIDHFHKDGIFTTIYDEGTIAMSQTDNAVFGSRILEGYETFAIKDGGDAMEIDETAGGHHIKSKFGGLGDVTLEFVHGVGFMGLGRLETPNGLKVMEKVEFGDELTVASTISAGGTISSGVSMSAPTASAGVKAFKIDHPLDPENKYLMHSCVESWERMNVYTGNVTTNQNGVATVFLPDYFEALNTDFRYQLTVVGVFAQAIIGEKIAGGKFTIKSNQPNVEVSWQVTGVRQDRFSKEHPLEVESEKEPEMKGKLLYSDYVQP